MRKLLVMVALAVLLAACSQQQPVETLEAQVANTWKPLGGALDVVTKNNTANAKLLLDRNGKPVVVWAEDNGLWYLQGKRWNGTVWEKLSFLTRPLAYTDAGVVPFDVVMDSSNALVITQPGKILRATTTWTQLGVEGTNRLQTDQYGRVHALFFSTTKGSTDFDNSFVKRWDGKAWQMVVNFKYLIPASRSAFGDFYITANDFLLKTDGKPIVISRYRTCQKCDNLSFFDWNGQTWSDIAGYSSPYGETFLLDYTLSGNNKVFTATLDYGYYTNIYSNTTGLGGLGGNAGLISLEAKNTSPVLWYSKEGVFSIALWNGSSFGKIGGDIRRDSAKQITYGDIVVDKNSTIFTLWQEAACTTSATCGGANVYVSQYVP